MTFESETFNFSALLNSTNALTLLENLTVPEKMEKEILEFSHHVRSTLESKKNSRLKFLSALNAVSTNMPLAIDTINNSDDNVATDGLIALFDTLFAEQQVQLVRSEGEPEYLPAINNQLARIKFAHGFFASALHEISHWCVAGKNRRQLSDYGYWYAPDGRTLAQQQAFECVEIKPQAIECLFTLACKRQFKVSQDNLFADFDTSFSTFPKDVYKQVIYYLKAPKTLPRDAQTLLKALLILF